MDWVQGVGLQAWKRWLRRQFPAPFTLNPWTLRFRERAVESTFSRHQEVDPVFLGRLALGAGLIFYSVFGIVDYLDHPQGYLELWRIRFGFGFPLITACLLGTLLTRRHWINDVLLFITIQGVGLSLIGMIWWGPGDAIGPYLSGFIVLLVYNFFAFRLRFLIATVSGAMLIGLFLVGHFIKPYGSGVVILSGAIFLLVTFLPLQFSAVLTELFMRRNYVQSARLDELARTDPLTGMPNRRAFMEELQSAIARSKRYGHRFSLALMDLDHFKRINDQYGHGVGDELLCQMHERVQPVLRSSDRLARLGGEEFAILLPETDARGAGETAERIRRSLAEAELLAPSGERISLTVSIGITTSGERDVTADRLLKEADDAMYRAKHAGRNRVSVAEPVAETD